VGASFQSCRRSMAAAAARWCAGPDLSPRPSPHPPRAEAPELPHDEVVARHLGHSMALRDILAAGAVR
jgi:hypothetical protein